MTLIIDTEFKALIPALSPDELSQLEASLLSEGCRDALVVWAGQGVLVDGHNRYELCTKHGIEYRTIEREFDDRIQVAEWMLRNQLGRRNLTDALRIQAARRFKDIIEAEARKRQSTSTGGVQPQLVEKLPQADSGKSRDKLGDIAGVSGKKYEQGEYIEDNAPEPIRKRWESGELSTYRAFRITKALKGASENVINVVAQYGVDEPKTVGLLARLEKSGLREDTNGTFDCIVRTGKIQPGDESEAVDITDDYDKLEAAVDTIVQQHKRVKMDEKKQQAFEQFSTVAPDSRYRILTGDLSILKVELADNSVDLFFTDPPYHEDKFHLYGELAALAFSKLKPGGLCLAYSGQMHIREVLNSMTESGLAYWWIFALEHTGGHLSIWNRQIWNDWKPIVAFAKPIPGEALPKAPQWTQDLIRGTGRDKEWHAWGQDAIEATYLIEKLTQINDLICDPFVGGGAIGVACKLTNRRYIGTEIDEKQAALARMRLSGEGDDKTVAA